MKLQTWDLPEAQRVFETLPLPLRLASLGPRFAAADTARDTSLTVRFVGVRDGTRCWINSVHLRPLPSGDGALGAISPYGYGGPLASDTDAAFLRDAWAAYGDWCRAHRVLAEFARFHPHAANQRFYGGATRENRQTVSVDLALPELTAQYNTLARRKLRRADGIAVRFSQAAADWDAFGPFYRAGMRAAGAADGYLFGDAYFRAISGVPQAWLCICEAAEGWLSAGIYLFGEAVAEYHLGASAPAGHERGSAYLMQHMAAKRARALGAHLLYLGGGTGTEPDNPLLFYKKCFSRRLLPFHTGHTIHDEPAYWEVAARAGHTRDHPPPRILLD